MWGYVRVSCTVAVLALVSACGTVHAVGASPSSTASAKKALPPICPQAAADVSAPACVSVGVDQDQQSNEMYNVRAPMPSSLAAKAQPETQRIRQALERLTPAQRENPSAVTAALRGAGMLSSGLVAYGPWDHRVTFGGYEPFNTKPAVCAFGHVTPTTVVVDIGGNTWEGSCYTSGSLGAAIGVRIDEDLGA
jgi:hypothetical protein